MNSLSILWNLDGTLFDTYPAITFTISKALNEMGLSIALNVIDGLARQSIDYCMETLSQRFKLDPDLLRARFAAFYRAIPPANQPPFPGVRVVCEFIQMHHGLNVIVTHRDVKSAQCLLDAHRLTSCFDDIFSIEQGYPRETDPSMLLAALKKHSLNPDDTLLIGDCALDIQAGRAAGIRTCLFRQTKLSEQADIYIETYSQLLDYLVSEM